MTTRYVVLPELRIPLEDRAAWATALRFIGDYQPDQVIQLGHLLNLPPSGRSTGQATIELRRRELTHTAGYIRHHYPSRLRTVHDGPLRIIHSTVSARLAAALQRKPQSDSSAATSCVVETREACVSAEWHSSSANRAAVRWTGRTQTGDATTAQRHPADRSGPDHDAGWPRDRTATQGAVVAIRHRSAIGSLPR